MTRRGVHFSPVDESEDQEEEAQSSSSEEEFDDVANNEIDREYSKLSISASVDSIVNAIVLVSPSYHVRYFISFVKELILNSFSQWLLTWARSSTRGSGLVHSTCTIRDFTLCLGSLCISILYSYIHMFLI